MKIRLLLFCMLMPLLASAAKHLEFKGIPITGTISSFTSKLNAQGFKTNWESTERSGDGDSYWYNGKYYGRDCELLVFYVPTSKIVYYVDVIFELESLNQAKNLMVDIKNALDRKYNLDFEETVSDGYPKWRTSVYDTSLASYPFIGSIFLTIHYNSVSELYNLHIGFIDSDNYDKYEDYLNDV